MIKTPINILPPEGTLIYYGWRAKNGFSLSDHIQEIPTMVFVPKIRLSNKERRFLKRLELIGAVNDETLSEIDHVNRNMIYEYQAIFRRPILTEGWEIRDNRLWGQKLSWGISPRVQRVLTPTRMP